MMEMEVFPVVEQDISGEGDMFRQAQIAFLPEEYCKVTCSFLSHCNY